MKRLLALLAVLSAGCHISSKVFVYDVGRDYITEWHYPKGKGNFPWYRSGWRRFCLVCNDDNCQVVVVAPSTQPCPRAEDYQ